ncbi:MAG: hypothetical protein ACI9HK_001091 [Pirellulaceae bacterium]|jgi:hypothetical protein
MLRKRNLTFFLLAFLLLVYVGCGGDTDTGTDPTSLTRVISRVADSGRDEGRFKELFASTATVPENREVYGKYQFEIQGTEGDETRTEIQMDIRDAINENLLGSFTWVATKENGEWKLLEAPVP